MKTPMWIRRCFARRPYGRDSRRSASQGKTSPRWRPNLEILEDRLAPATLTVNTLADSSTITNQLTLREAVALVNSGGNPSILGQPTMPSAWASQISGTFGQGDTIQFASGLATQNAGYGAGVVALKSIGDTSIGPSALAIGPGTNVTINGPTGSSGITIERAPNASAMRLFLVASARTTAGSLTLENLTLTGGDAVGGNGGNGFVGGGGGGAAGLGGAIFVEGLASLTILNSTLTGNTAQGGNGGFAYAPSNIIFKKDQGAGGGGLSYSGQSPLVIYPSYMNNGGGPNGGTGYQPGAGHAAPAPAGFGGGGGGGSSYYNSSDSYGEPGGNGGFGGGGGGGGHGVASSAILHDVGGGNGGYGGWGGGGGGGGNVSNQAGTSLYSNGRYGIAGYGGGNGGSGNGTGSGTGGGAAGMGGAIYNDGGFVTITNSTLTGNSALGGQPGNGHLIVPVGPIGQTGEGLGGAVFNDNGILDISYGTLDGNTADKGGALFSIAHGFSTAVSLSDSILADTTKGNTDFWGVGSSGTTEYIAGAPNLIQNNNGFVPSSGSPELITGESPQLGSLVNSGGPTSTMEPLTGSPVINQGTAIANVNFDQRGLPRDFNNQIDLGAVELNPATITVNTSNNANTDPNSLSLFQAVQLADGTLTRTGLAPAQNQLVQGDLTSGVTTIQFATSLAGQTINLTSSMDSADAPTALLVTGSLTIDGLSGGNNGVSLVGPGSSGNLRLFRVAPAASLTLENLTLSGGNVISTAPFGGGAILNQGQLTVVNCTLSGDSVQGSGAYAFGGAIFNFITGRANIIQCTFYGDKAYGSSGGNGQPAGQGAGGAVFNLDGAITLTNSTLAGDSADAGSDIFNFGGESTDDVTLNNSILDDSTTTAADYDQAPGSLSSGTNDLIQVNNGFAGGIVSSANPLLSTLGNHGGPTPTLLPQAGSPAINAGSNVFLGVIAQAEGVSPSAATDQRGQPRLSGTNMDIGSVETQSTSNIPPSTTAVALQFLPLAATTTAGQGPGTVQVELLNQAGQVLSSDNSDRVTLSGVPLTNGNTLTATVHDGIATFTNVVIAQAGSYTLTAASGSLSPVQTELTVMAAAPINNTPPPARTPAASLNAPPLLVLLDDLFAGMESVNADDSVTVTDSLFGVPFLVSTFDPSGHLVSVDWFGFNVTFLFL